MKLSAFGMFLLFVSCAASQPQAEETPWRVEVTTSGGITGRGTGTYAIGSDGEITVTTTRGRTCTFQATEPERARFVELLSHIRAEQWKASYVPEDRCCDRIEYTMTIDEGTAERKVTWIDDPAPMPEDLAALVNAMTGVAPSLRTEYGGKCN